MIARDATKLRLSQELIPLFVNILMVYSEHAVDLGFLLQCPAWTGKRYKDIFWGKPS